MEKSKPVLKPAVAHEETSPPTEMQNTQSPPPEDVNPDAATQYVAEAALEEQAAANARTMPGEKAASKPPKVNTLGDFRIVKKLGEGGMGAVYKAIQISLERDVAVKVLTKTLAANKEFVTRFQREAKIMAKIDHPNVLRCIACGEDKGMHYFAMEYVDGGNMEGWLKKLGRFSVGDSVHILLACASALQHAHEQSLIHRDIKPDNILLNSKGVVKVADLGLAKATSEDLGLTKTGTGAGTPLYMAPEQCRDMKHVDGRADIYSLGCMLYYFLTGQLPFSGATVVELYEAKEKGKFPPARQFNDEVPERLDLIIDKMVAKKPELRYQNCADLINDLAGLGVANETLSFVEVTGSTSSVRVPLVPTGARPPVQKTVALSAPKPGSGARPAIGPNKSGPQPEAGVWYLSFENRDGNAIKRKMTTMQVVELIKDEHFDVRAQAAKNPDGPYRLLSSYSEFEPALRGRIQRLKTDRKTAKFQDMYKKLEKEAIQQQKRRWWRDLIHKMVGGMGLAMWLAVIGGLLVGGYFLFRYVIGPWLNTFFTKITS